MSRHIIDRPKQRDSALVAQFVRIARGQGQHASVRALVARSLDRANARISAFSRISRGQST